MPCLFKNKICPLCKTPHDFLVESSDFPYDVRYYFTCPKEALKASVLFTNGIDWHQVVQTRPPGVVVAYLP